MDGASARAAAAGRGLSGPGRRGRRRDLVPHGQSGRFSVWPVVVRKEHHSRSMCKPPETAGTQSHRTSPRKGKVAGLHPWGGPSSPPVVACHPLDATRRECRVGLGVCPPRVREGARPCLTIPPGRTPLRRRCAPLRWPRLTASVPSMSRPTSARSLCSMAAATRSPRRNAICSTGRTCPGAVTGEVAVLSDVDRLGDGPPDQQQQRGVVPGSRPRPM